ncbi:MAG: phosphate regulon sensor protein PhoR, partial [Gammaproteobacteria bacterium]
MQYQDIWRLLGLFAAALLVGLVTDLMAWALFGAACLYIAWTQRELGRLLRWLRDRKSCEPPEHAGVYEELTLEIDYLRERHKKRKKKLASYLKQFQQATRALPDATVVLDTHDEVRWANGAARRDLGVCWPEDVGQRITNLVRNPELRDYMETTRDEEGRSLEIVCPMDAERHLSILTAPYGNDQRILVARDTTDLQRANQIRSDFVANVSHELRTPITVFRGYLETLLGQAGQGPAAWRMAFENMAAHADRMQNLVNELLLLSSLEAENRVRQPQTVDVPALVGELHDRARELSGELGHLFSLEIDGDLCVAGSRDELYSAFSNLLFNAVQYTPARGVVRVRWYRDEAGAHFAVEDNGIGIAPEHLPRLT